MAGKTDFSAVLVRQRESAGFPTPFGFYKGRDGRRALGLSFPNYLKLERGQSLPQPKRLEPLLSALGLEPGSAQARELVRAYLRSVLGSDRLLDLAAGGAKTDPAPPSWLLAETASRQAIGQRKVQLSLDQYGLLAKEPVAYVCHAVLANTQGWLTKAELSKFSGKPAAAVAKALAALEKAGLAELDGAKARSPLAGKFVTPPAATPLTASIYAALQKHRESWAGRAVRSHYLILRARKDGMESYLPHLADAVSLSAIYGDVKPGDDSEFYLVEGRVTRLFE
ncbi:MAG: hypothetical protein HY925_06675 [Elusimicrobia bacterium]|nr:hypothetical protein [Elusimicrobiota bacterium]